jgi:(E)-4-hydroxy-3-methylbut-2-enyl-diphosphate synthase
MGVAIFSKNIEDDAIYVMSLEKSFDCHKPYAISVNSEENWDKLLLLSPQIIFLEIKDGFHVARKFISWLKEKNIVVPVILSFPYKDLCNDDLVINASSEIGSLFCDGLGAGISIKSSCSILLKYSLSFGILQAAGKRTTKTEFISCPGCGRTLFDLQETSKKIREKTSHLPGIKIAIMGCIVNGPGEMADADFGYVGAGSDKVNLYIGKNCVEKNIGSAEAENKLIELIKREKKWKEK